MGLPHAVLKNFHPMIGRDLHIPWPPGSPSPAPSPVPYVTTSIMMGIGATCNKAEDVLSQYYGLTMLKVTDIGPLIPHIGAPSVLLAVEIPMSSSKSYFGCGKYVSKGQPVAVALLGQTNLNLNCGTPVPTPFGQVIALTTHYMDMSLGDILSGVLQMGFDFVLAWALNKLGSALGSKITSALGPRLFARFLPGATEAAMREGGDVALSEAFAGVQAAVRSELVSNVAGTAVSTVAGFFFGSPMGIDASTFGTYGKNSDGDNRGGIGDMSGAGYSKGGDALGQYLGGGPPGGPVDIGSGANE
jgi:hypothetical protein